MKSFAWAILITAACAVAHAQLQYSYSPRGYACADSTATIRMRADRVTYTKAVLEVTKTNAQCSSNGSFKADGTVYIKDAQTGNTIASAGYHIYDPWVKVTVPLNFAGGSRQMRAVIYSGQNTYATAPITFTPVDVIKIGVVVFRHGRSVADVMRDVDSVVASVGAGSARRDGLGRRAQLAIELEVPWAETATNTFDWYTSFAAACESRNVKWVPLLSPHYLPPTVRDKYASHAISTMSKSAITSTFLPIAPSSGMWGGEAAAWVNAFILTMANTNHFGPTAAIDEVLIGNEMGFPIDASKDKLPSALTSGDAATAGRYKALYGTLPPSTLTATFKNFRATELSYAINAMLTAAKQRLAAADWSDVGVTTKLVTYQFPGRTNMKCDPNASFSDCYFGYTDDRLSYLGGQFVRVFGFDSYPAPPTRCGSWKFTNDLSAAASKSSGKALFVAEFNVPLTGGCTQKLSSDEVREAVLVSANSYNTRGFFLYSLNSGDVFQLEAPQLDGLRRAFVDITK